MLAIVGSTYVITLFLQILKSGKRYKIPLIEVGEIKKLVEPKFIAFNTTIKSPRFRKFFKRSLKLIFFSLIFIYIGYTIINLLKKLFIIYQLYNSQQLNQLEGTGRKLVDLLTKLAENLADEMIAFLRYHNIVNHLTREHWIQFFKEILLGETEAFSTFRTLLEEILKKAFKNENYKLQSINEYSRCILEVAPDKPLPSLFDKRFLHSMKKIDQRYWNFSYLNLKKYLNILKEVYADSNLKNNQVRLMIQCLKQELQKRVSTLS